MASIQSSLLRGALQCPNSPSAIAGGGVQAIHGGWQLTPIQELLRNAQDYFGVSGRRFFALLLVFSVICYQILTGCPLDEATAVLVFVIVILMIISLGITGTKHWIANQVRDNMKTAPNKQLLILIWSLLTSMIDGAPAGIHTNHLERSCKLLEDSSVWLIRDYAKAAAVTVLPGFFWMLIGAWIARWRMTVNGRRQEVLNDDPIVQALEESPFLVEATPCSKFFPACDSNDGLRV